MSPTTWKAILLLASSKVSVTFAWYAHPKCDMKAKPWIVGGFIELGIALFEYLLQVLANRIGSSEFFLPQLKIL